MMIADACDLGVAYLYDTKRKKWMKNICEEKVLYISTELEKEEIQTCFLAYISGVDEEIILNATYTSEEEDRIDKAIEILENSPIFIEYISDFDIDDIETLIQRYIIDEDINYCMFDYIHTSPKLLASITQKTNGMKLREDQVLFLFSNALKILAGKYEIFMESSTQLNRSYKDEENLDTGALRGSSAIGDKLDIGIITTSVNAKEMERVEKIIETYNKENSYKQITKKPNMSHTIYKNRGSKFKGYRIWTSMNLGNMREEVLFVTDMNFKIKTIDLHMAEPMEETEEDKKYLNYLNNVRKPTVTF